MAVDVREVVVTIIGQLGDSMDVKVKDISDPALKTEISSLLNSNRIVIHGRLIKRQS